MSAPDFTSATWRKSTFSNGNGNCVEIAFADWRKSSFGNGNGDCVEIASAPTHVGIRDTKNPVPHLAIPHPAWSALLTTLR